MPRGRKPLQSTRPGYAGPASARFHMPTEAMCAAMMANMIKRISAADEVRAFVEVNKSEYFKRIALPMPDGEFRLAENIDEFCRVVFGRGYKAMADQKILLERLGEETYESANRLGLNRGQLRLLVSMPEEDRALVEDVMRSESKPDVIAVIQALASKPDEVRAKVDELKAEDKAKLALLAAKGSTIDALNTKLLRRDNAPADERLDHLRKEITSIADDARGAIIGLLRQRLHELAEHHNQAGGDSQLWAAGILGQLSKDIVTLRDEMGIPDLAGCEVPEWLEEPLTAPAAEPPGHDEPEPGKPH